MINHHNSTEKSDMIRYIANKKQYWDILFLVRKRKKDLKSSEEKKNTLEIVFSY